MQAIVQAIVQERYGGPDVLSVKEVDKPLPGENEVLVRVHAVAVNDYDWCMMRGKPCLYRLLFGLRKPKHPIPGMELSGTVEALGERAGFFSVGDAVYGDISEVGFGAFAEYLCVNEKALRPKPAGIPHSTAAAIPHAAGLAQQGLIETGQLKPGQNVLINGAGGGVGTLCLALAKQVGAEVTGVDTGDKLTMMMDIGFDHVIDYREHDFTRHKQGYDLILDTKTKRSPFALLRSLAKGGRYVTVGGDLPRLAQIFLLRPLLFLVHKRAFHIVALTANQGLRQIEDFYAAGYFTPVIDGPHNFQDIPQLIQYFGEGKHTGKVVVSLVK